MRKNQNHKQSYISDFVDYIMQDDGTLIGIFLGCIISIIIVLIGCFLKGSFSIVGI